MLPPPTPQEGLRCHAFLCILLTSCSQLAEARLELAPHCWEGTGRESNSYYVERDQCRKDRLFPQVEKLEGRSRKLKGKNFSVNPHIDPPLQKKKNVCNCIKSSMSAGTTSHFSLYDLHLCTYWAPAVCQAHCGILSRVLIYPPNWAGEQIVGN